MNFIIKKYSTLIFLTVLIGSLFLPSFVEASEENKFKEIFENLTKLFFEWAVYLAAIAIGVCIILIASSGGDPKRLNDAKRALMYVAIGLGIVELEKGFTFSATMDIKTGAEMIAMELGTIAAIVGAIFLSYGVFEFATSGGDPRKLDEAKTIILWSGIAVVLGAAGATGGFSGIITAAKAESAAEQILNIFGGIAAILGAGILAFGMFKFAISGGDPRALAEAQTLLMWGVIGVILGVFLTKGISTVLSYFGIEWK